MARLTEDQKIKPHWFVKTMAGLVLGLTLAFAFIGIFAWFGPGGIDAHTKVQFNMWMITPIWLLVFSFSYLFQTGRKAVIYLVSANICVYSVFIILRWLA